MTEQPQLHSTIVAMVSLAAGIAANHPAMGQCQLRKLREAGVPEHQIKTVIEIARHLRDEAAQKLDAEFDREAGLEQQPVIETAAACCGSTASGQSCC